MKYTVVYWSELLNVYVETENSPFDTLPQANIEATKHDLPVIFKEREA